GESFQGVLVSSFTVRENLLGQFYGVGINKAYRTDGGVAHFNLLLPGKYIVQELVLFLEIHGKHPHDMIVNFLFGQLGYRYPVSDKQIDGLLNSPDKIM